MQRQQLGHGSLLTHIHPQHYATPCSRLALSQRVDRLDVRDTKSSHVLDGNGLSQNGWLSKPSKRSHAGGTRELLHIAKLSAHFPF